mmetsp:Transcript_14493/g.22655  ORF Transcript_14493/g.22655 Transcript_14493/m.22655 type:complete len:93 (-) Transcript_14493:675-953(-)
MVSTNMTCHNPPSFTMRCTSQTILALKSALECITYPLLIDDGEDENVDDHLFILLVLQYCREQGNCPSLTGPCRPKSPMNWNLESVYRQSMR